jgi:hypothetical protein
MYASMYVICFGDSIASDRISPDSISTIALNESRMLFPGLSTSSSFNMSYGEEMRDISRDLAKKIVIVTRTKECPRTQCPRTQCPPFLLMLDTLPKEMLLYVASYLPPGGMPTKALFTLAAGSSVQEHS